MTEDVQAQVTVWGSQPDVSKGFLGGRGVSLKIGPKVLRAVKLADYGNGETGVVKSRRLLFQTHNKKGGLFYLATPDAEFSIYDGEIDVLRDLLNDKCPPGEYLLVKSDSATTELLELASGNQEAAKTILSSLTEDMPAEELAAALQASSTGLTGAELAVIGRRRSLIGKANSVAADPSSNETDMQRLLDRQHWMFGGQYVGVFGRRNALQLDQHDIPLVRADGSLHIVELKGPNIAKLVIQHRNHYIVGPEVHEATMQAANYIRSADEQGLQVAQNLAYEGVKVDLRRVFATVVMGHREHVQLDDDVIDQALRTYNASLSRIEVVTYDQLLDAASRALNFTAGEAEPVPAEPPTPDDVPW